METWTSRPVIDPTTTDPKKLAAPLDNSVMVSGASAADGQTNGRSNRKRNYY
ncbi:hypothetical protein D1AOALGA4SA_10068 [Olavius algarvensis Delta 1 endosymbiont]|nr:hypothetical protein D1AOALGA4SA_10068 [Olavius algarvensis Delta 1 endosymbiont]